MQPIDTLPVVTVREDASLREAARRMLDERVGALVVVDAGGRAVGMLTDRDLTVRAVAWDRSPSDTPVSEVMSTPLVGLEVDQANLGRVVGIMRSSGLRRVPVLVDQRPVGLVAFDDVLHDLTHWLRDLAAVQVARLRGARTQEAAADLLDELREGMEHAREKMREVGWKAQEAFFHELDDLRERVRRALD